MPSSFLGGSLRARAPFRSLLARSRTTIWLLLRLSLLPLLRPAQSTMMAMISSACCRCSASRPRVLHRPSPWRCARTLRRRTNTTTTCTSSQRQAHRRRRQRASRAVAVPPATTWLRSSQWLPRQRRSTRRPITSSSPTAKRYRSRAISRRRVRLPALDVRVPQATRY